MPYELASKEKMIMKFRILVLLLLGIFVSALYIQTTYAQTEDESKNYLSYENNTIGLNLKYPDDWNLMESSRPDLPFVARIWAPGATGLISVDHVYRDTEISPEKIAESHIKILENRRNDLKVIESKSLLVSNYPAWQVTYSTADHIGRKLIESEVYITNDNSRYVFSYSVWEGFPNHLPVFNAIIDSVQINPTDRKNFSDKISETSVIYIPDWVEHNARWWNEEQIDDNTMISSIQFLAEHKIIGMPSIKEIDVYKIFHRDTHEIYDMIKHSAWRWADEGRGEYDFLRGIGYLASVNSQDESSNNSENLENCPKSFSSRCFTGKITEIIDGGTIQVDDISIQLTLVSTPKLDEEGGQDAKGVVKKICPIGTHVLVDQDNMYQSDEFISDAMVLAVVYCDGLNLNEVLIHREPWIF